MPHRPHTCTGFVGHRLLHRGTLEEVARRAKAELDGGATDRIAVYDDTTCHAIDLDFRGTPEEVVARLAGHPALGRARSRASGPEGAPAPRRGPGRPRLGVVSREVTLLPRHWTWLKTQRGGASAALRRLVDEARRKGEASDRVREAQDAVHRFLWDMASDLPEFEEASRAFFARDDAAFFDRMADWPEDVRAHVRYLVESHLSTSGSSGTRTPGPSAGT